MTFPCCKYKEQEQNGVPAAARCLTASVLQLKFHTKEIFTYLTSRMRRYERLCNWSIIVVDV